MVKGFNLRITCLEDLKYPYAKAPGVYVVNLDLDESQITKDDEEIVIPMNKDYPRIAAIRVTTIIADDENPYRHGGPRHASCDGTCPAN